MLQRQKSAYTDEQLDGYDRYRDIIRRERTLVSESHREGFEEGKAEGIAEGRADTIRQLFNSGMPIGQICSFWDITPTELKKILRK